MNNSVSPELIFSPLWGRGHKRKCVLHAARPICTHVFMRAFVLLLCALLSGGEDLAALVAAAGKHVAAVAGLHALTEAVNLFALPFLRLECTKHFFCTSFPNVLYHAAPCPVAKADWKYAFF